MARDLAAFAAMALFIFALGLVLPDLAATIHSNPSAIVAAK